MECESGLEVAQVEELRTDETSRDEYFQELTEGLYANKHQQI